jgi:hypothetical protein
MTGDNDTLFDILRAIGFVLAVVIGGLFIAGFIDGWNDAKGPAETPVQPASSVPDRSD